MRLARGGVKRSAMVFQSNHGAEFERLRHRRSSASRVPKIHSARVWSALHFPRKRVSLRCKEKAILSKMFGVFHFMIVSAAGFVACSAFAISPFCGKKFCYDEPPAK